MTSARDHGNATQPSFQEVKGNDSTAFDLSFFGVNVKAWVADSDRDHVEFFYRPYLNSTTDDPDIEVALKGPQGFFTSLLAKDGKLKTIAVREKYSIKGSPYVEHVHTFTEWSGMPAPLPPFSSQILQRKLIVAAGAVVVSQKGVGVALRGPNYVGKSAVSLALLRRSWRLVSDHLLIVDRMNGETLSYLSPIGFRRATLEENLATLARIETRETVSEVTGRVVLARPEDLFPNQIAERTVVDRIVQLEPTPLATRHIDLLPKISTFPSDASEELRQHLP